MPARALLLGVASDISPRNNLVELGVHRGFRARSIRRLSTQQFDPLRGPSTSGARSESSSGRASRRAGGSGFFLLSACPPRKGNRPISESGDPGPPPAQLPSVASALQKG